MQLAAFGHGLDGEDGRPLRLAGRRDAGLGGHPVHEDRAGPAACVVAAALAAGEVQVLAQDVEQTLPAVEVDPAGLAVDGELEDLLDHHCTSPAAC